MNAVAPRPSGLLDAGGNRIAARDIARIRSRAMLDGGAAPFSYDAAGMSSQELAGWNPWLRGPDAEVNYDRDRMVARSRDLVRNDGWAAGAVTTTADAAIGNHFRLQVRPDTRALARLDRRFDATWAAEFQAETEAEFRLWADDPNHYADAEQTLTLTQQFYLQFRHKLIDGDNLTMLLWAPERLGIGAARYATTVAAIDPDRLSNPYQVMDTHELRGGVRVDRLGAPVAYNIRRAHQNDWYDAALSMVWDEYPRRTPWGRTIVAHDFDKDRNGQHRGLGFLTPILARFKMLAQFDRVSLQAAVLRTVVGYFIKSAFGADQIEDALTVKDTAGGRTFEGGLADYCDFRDAARDPVTMGGVKVPVLAPNESVETVRANEGAQDFETFEAAVLRSIAAGTGSSATEVTKNYSDVNYSSARADMLTAWRTLTRRRANFGHGTATPIYAAWLEEAVVEYGRARLPLPRGVSLAEFAEYRGAFARCTWIGPGRGWVDPVKEREGEQMGLESGFGTLAETCANINGMDWREVLDQRAIERAEWQRHQLPEPTWLAGRIAGKQRETAETEA